jgi:hypothetical protein
MPGYQVGFLEKSYDESGWWAKYWLVVFSSSSCWVPKMMGDGSDG